VAQIQRGMCVPRKTRRMDAARDGGAAGADMQLCRAFLLGKEGLEEVRTFFDSFLAGSVGHDGQPRAPGPDTR
jgi:hypothetical protein